MKKVDLVKELCDIDRMIFIPSVSGGPVYVAAEQNLRAKDALNILLGKIVGDDLLLGNLFAEDH